MNQREPTPQLEGSFSVRFAAIFYLLLGLGAWGLAALFGGYDPFVWHDENATSIWFDAGSGVGFGLLVVLLTRVLEEYFEWARTLGQEFGKVLGELDVEASFLSAGASRRGEELFFRGCLQQVLSEGLFTGGYARWIGLAVVSLLFGLLHIGPDLKKFLPWTIMAIVFGGAFGWLFMYTGNLLAPILAHFTINFFNILSITQKHAGDASHDG